LYKTIEAFGCSIDMPFVGFEPIAQTSGVAAQAFSTPETVAGWTGEAL
jgi:hypothetical protein